MRVVRTIEFFGEEIEVPGTLYHKNYPIDRDVPEEDQLCIVINEDYYALSSPELYGKIVFVWEEERARLAKKRKERYSIGNELES